MSDIVWPEVPEGYFFRVTEGPTGIEYPFVELRRRLKWFGSVRVTSKWQKRDHRDSNTEVIQFLAQATLDEARIGEEDRFLGDSH